MPLGIYLQQPHLVEPSPFFTELVDTLGGHLQCSRPRRSLKVIGATEGAANPKMACTLDSGDRSRYCFETCQSIQQEVRLQNAESVRGWFETRPLPKSIGQKQRH